MQECLNYFKYSDNKNINIFLENLLNAKHISGNIFTSKTNIYYINFAKTLIDEDFILGLNFQLNNPNLKLYFLYEQASENFKNLLNNSPKKINSYSFQDAYFLMKNINYFPIKKVIKTKQNKPFFKSILNTYINAISKKHFKDFFISGTSLVLISFFIPFSLYYKIFGSFMLIISIFCLFRKNKTEILNSESLTSIIKK